MTTNNNISVLPWYKTIEEQNHRKSYAYGEVYPLFAQAGMLLPFQIIREHRVNEVTTVNLYQRDGQPVASIASQMAEAGLTTANIVKTTVFLADMSLFAEMNAVYATYFEGDFPARSAFAVKALPKGALVEIESIAVR